MNTPTTGSGVPTVDGTSASCPGREHLECSGGSALCAGPTQDSRLCPSTTQWREGGCFDEDSRISCYTFSPLPVLRQKRGEIPNRSEKK